MLDDRMKNFVGAALDLEIRTLDVFDGKPGAKKALIIALKNFDDARRSLKPDSHGTHRE
jgi:hypothetical protein